MVKTTNEEYWPIGKVVYGVHEHYNKNDGLGARLLVCRVVSYQNIDGAIYPVYRQVGTKHEPNPLLHTFYSVVDDAIKAITPRKTGKKANSVGKTDSRA